MSALWLLAVVNVPISGGWAASAACRLNASRKVTGDEYVTMSGRSDWQRRPEDSALCKNVKACKCAYLQKPRRTPRQPRVQRRLQVAHHGVAGLHHSPRALSHETAPRVAHPHAVANEPQPQRGRRLGRAAAAVGRGSSAGKHGHGRRVLREVRRNLRAGLLRTQRRASVRVSKTQRKRRRYAHRARTRCSRHPAGQGACAKGERNDAMWASAAPPAGKRRWRWPTSSGSPRLATPPGAREALRGPRPPCARASARAALRRAPPTPAQNAPAPGTRRRVG